MTSDLFHDFEQSKAARTGYASPVAWRDWPFGDLPPAGFDVIMADPPWAYKMRGKTGYGKSPQAHYDCIDIDDLCALPVARLAAPNSLLWLWTTWPFLANGAAHKLVKAWGFEPKTGLPWKKLTKTGKTSFATGYILRSCTEVVLIAVRGAPAYDDSYCASTRGLIEAEARQHSRKPDCAYEMAERLVPAARRLDLFARERRAGWSAWGNEIDKFEMRPTAAEVEQIEQPPPPSTAQPSASSVAADDDLLEIPFYLRRDPATNRLLSHLAAEGASAPAGRVFP
jgi:N6-adenosine-specific RNA methylase IME4